MSASKLSPSLKRIIAVGADPPLLSSRNAQRFQTVLQDFGREAGNKGVRDEAWMMLTVRCSLKDPGRNADVGNEQTAALVALNRPSAFPPFWSHIRSLPSSSAPILLSRASLVRETALKTISFTGIAKAINNLAAIKATIAGQDAEVWKALEAEVKGRRGPAEWGADGKGVKGIEKRGEELWKSVYRPFDDKLVSKLGSYHPDLPLHIVYSHYGPLLSDPPSPPSYPGSVGRLATSLVAIGTLRASGELGPQLVSHVFGLKKAGEEAEGDEKVLGAQAREDVGEGWKWLCGDEGCEWAVNVVDRVSECVRMDGEDGTVKAKL